MLLADNVVGIIDCGMVGRLDPNLHDDFEGLLLSMAQADPAILADTLWKLSKGKPAGGRAQLQADLSDLLAEATEVSVDEIDMGGLLRSLTGVIQKYKISLRPALTQLLRTLVLLEGTSQRLDPKFGLGEVIKPYCEKLVVERFAPERIARRLARSYRDWERLLETLPHDLEDAIGQIQTGGLQVRVDLRNLDTIVNRLVLGLVLSALLLGSSLLWSLKAPPLAHDISVFGAAGYFLALGVGWILLRSMQKSGRRTRD
jgi:ubiquinone biosynthesis protein